MSRQTREEAPLLGDFGLLPVPDIFTRDKSSVMNVTRKMDCPDADVLAVGKMKRDHGMTQLFRSPLSADNTTRSGGTDDLPLF